MAAFGLNFKATELHVPVAVYVIFIILMAAAFFVALFCIIEPSSVRRQDGSPIAHYPHQGFWQEFKNQRRLLQDWRLLVMFIPMLASEVALIVLSSLNCMDQNPQRTWAVSDADTNIQRCTSTFEHDLSTR